MTSPLDYPRLRWPLEVRREQLEGQDILLVRCPMGFASEPLLLVPAVGPILATFNGTLSIQQIAERFQPYGVSPEFVREIAKHLDTYRYLDTPEFRSHEASVKAQFAELPVRPAIFAGLSYPESPQELSLFLEEYLRNGEPPSTTPSGPLKLLVTPHIDYRRGGATYGRAYHLLKNQDHDLYILMGTAHQYSERLFHLTRKHFCCPLSDAHNDTDFTDELAQCYGTQRSFEDEFLHKQEHSIELQIPFLKRVRPTSIIVPILVGSFHRFLSRGSPPESAAEYDEFIAILSELVAKRVSQGMKICFIAGVDMAHIGRTFGDSGNLTPEIMERIRERDSEYLETIKQRRKDLLLDHIASDNDARRICGFPTMYAILDTMERLSINCPHSLCFYDQAVDYQSDCAVTFAGVGMYGVR